MISTLFAAGGALDYGVIFRDLALVLIVAKVAAEIFERIRIPDVVHNQRGLGGHAPQLISAARSVGDILLRSKLLRTPPTLSAFCDASYLPEAV